MDNNDKKAAEILRTFSQSIKETVENGIKEDEISQYLNYNGMSPSPYFFGGIGGIKGNLGINVSPQTEAYMKRHVYGRHGERFLEFGHLLYCKSCLSSFYNGSYKRCPICSRAGLKTITLLQQIS